MSATLMGVLNVTPDSFSDGGLYLDPASAIERGRSLIADGASLLDVGGESTRPGAAPVSEDEEKRRVVGVIEAVSGAGIPVSVDTSKLGVAEAALDSGAEIVNDVTALGAAPGIAGLCADRGAGLVLMHMQGDPRTMQAAPHYDEVVSDVKAFLAERLALAVGEGVAEEKIWLDPGIGFGKTLEHNLELLRRLGELADLGRPLVVGTSRKSFIAKIDDSPVEDRIGGTIASSVMAYRNGASILRVHDVAEAAQAFRVADVLLGRREWRRPASAS